MNQPSRDLPSLRELRETRDRLRNRVHHTPLLSSRTLSEKSGARVFLKCENLQRTGSFKVRGALNACLLATESGAVGKGGMLTYSSGNHGQAVALAARILGFQATVVVPESIPRVKEEAISGYGAQIERCGQTSEDRYRRSLEIAGETGALIVPPFDHPHTIAGQGSVGLEILEDLPDADTILVPVGGGGLIAGISIASVSRGRRVRVIGVEPETANAMYLSLDAGKTVTLTSPPNTIADGLCPVRPGNLTLLACQRHVERIVLIDDPAIRQAQRLLLERAKLLVEPSGAAAAAALLKHKTDFKNQTVAIVLSGGNTELESLL